jgi:hypothetical protein
MPSVSLSPAPKLQFFGTDGNPLVGGKVYTYAAGTTTPLTTYYDSTGTAANTNPIILDTRGEANIWLTSAAYKFVLKTSTDTLIWTVDNITSAEYLKGLLAAPNGATLIGYTPSDTNIPETVNSRLQLLDGASVTAGALDSYSGASVNVFRNASGVTGGTAGFVNAASVARTTTGANETSFEWTTLSIMDNYSAAGENVAFYGQGNKRAVGGTWGGVFEARDFTQVANPIGGLVGLEVDVFANGTDTGNERIGIDIVTGKGVSSGTLATVGIGIRIGPVNADVSQGQFTNGIELTGNINTGLNIASSGIWGAYFSGTNTVGIDLSQGTNTISAIRIKGGENIAFDSSSFYRLQHKSTGVAGLVYSVNGADVVVLSDVGGIVLNETVSWTSAYAFTSATAGTNGAPPAQVGGYIKVNINGVFVKIPYYGL